MSRSSAITWCVIGITTSHFSLEIRTSLSRFAAETTGSALSSPPPKAPGRYRFLSTVSRPSSPTLRRCLPDGDATSTVSYSGRSTRNPRMLELIHLPLNSAMRLHRSSMGTSVSWLPKHTYWMPRWLSMSIMPLPRSRLDSSEGARKSPGSMVMVLGRMLALMRPSRKGRLTSSYTSLTKMMRNVSASDLEADRIISSCSAKFMKVLNSFLSTWPSWLESTRLMKLSTMHSGTSRDPTYSQSSFLISSLFRNSSS
mmetsp:Transcript_76645/g.206503  ORF Transcript_76645/g.206503 Transcript_76645/m.206503 type:complete len:255 (+) Transcript_76645:1192-1956(+)